MSLLYKACVRPHLEYAYPVWCTNNSITPLTKVQTTALRNAAGAMGGTSTDALEVITNILPLDIRLQEKLLSDFIKINSKPTNDPMRQLVYRLLEDPIFTDDQIRTPIHIYKMASRNYNIYPLMCNIEKHINENLQDITGLNDNRSHSMDQPGQH